MFSELVVESQCGLDRLGYGEVYFLVILELRSWLPPQSRIGSDPPILPLVKLGLSPTQFGYFLLGPCSYHGLDSVVRGTRELDGFRGISD